LTIREAAYEHYHAKEFEDGTVVLEPRVLVVPNALLPRRCEPPKRTGT
jgi:hypothetical protein